LTILLSAHRDERRQLFGRSTSRSYSSQMEPELSCNCPNQASGTDDVARAFFQAKAERSERSRLGAIIGLTHNPKHMTADDVSKLAAFAYHSQDIFKTY